MELMRFMRHAFAPLVIYAVERGWLPEAAQADVIEALVIAVAFAIPYGLSWLRDRKRPT